MLKKSISALLIVSQFSMASMVWAAGPTETATPEFTLLQNVIALQGQNLSQKDLQSQVNQAVNTYLTTASPAGHEERLAQAMIALGVYTPAQTAAVMAQFQDAETRLAAQNITDQKIANQLVSREIERITQLNPSGAQFSACDRAKFITEVSLAAFLGCAIVGLATGAYLSSDGTSHNGFLIYGGLAGMVGVIVGSIMIEDSCS